MSDTDSDEGITPFGLSKRQRTGRVDCVHCGEKHFPTIPCANAPAYRPGQGLQMPPAPVPPPRPPQAQTATPSQQPVALSAFRSAPRAVAPRPGPLRAAAPRFRPVIDHSDDDEPPELVENDDDVEYDDTINGDIDDPVTADDPVEDQRLPAGVRWVEHELRPNPIRRNLLDPQSNANMYPKPEFHGFDAGAKNIPNNVWTPLDYFKLFFDSKDDGTGVADKFLSAVNRYGLHYYSARLDKPSSGYA